MTIHIKKLKVRPKKGKKYYFFCWPCSNIQFVAAQTALCAPELSAMLACWAATGDLHNTKDCSETAQVLFQCMRRTVRPCRVPGIFSARIVDHCCIFFWCLFFESRIPSVECDSTRTYE